MLLRGGARASPRVTLDSTVGQKRKWKCHVNVFVMQADHVARDRGCLWFMLCQSVSLSNSKMGFFWALCLCETTTWKTFLPTFGRRHGLQGILLSWGQSVRLSVKLVECNMFNLTFQVRVWIHYLLFICSCDVIMMRANLLHRSGLFSLCFQMEKG